MGTPLIGMTLKEACDTVKDYADMHTGGDLLAGIKDMEACYDDLDREDRTAYNMFIKAGQEMFMADE
jgi:hypothetical protein